MTMPTPHNPRNTAHFRWPLPAGHAGLTQMLEIPAHHLSDIGEPDALTGP